MLCNHSMYDRYIADTYKYYVRFYFFRKQSFWCTGSNCRDWDHDNIMIIGELRECNNPFSSIIMYSLCPLYTSDTYNSLHININSTNIFRLKYLLFVFVSLLCQKKKIGKEGKSFRFSIEDIKKEYEKEE